MSAETVFTIVLLASASILCIALVIYINRITKSIKEMEGNIKDLSFQLKPLIASTTNLSEKLNQITEDIKEPIGLAKDIVGDVKERVDKILHLEQKIREGIERPANELVSSLSAVVNGVNAFWHTYRRR